MQAFQNPIPSLKTMARLNHVKGNLKLLVEYWNNELGAVVLRPRTDLCEMEAYMSCAAHLGIQLELAQSCPLCFCKSFGTWSLDTEDNNNYIGHYRKAQNLIMNMVFVWELYWLYKLCNLVLNSRQCCSSSNLLQRKSRFLTTDGWEWVYAENNCASV